MINSTMDNGEYSPKDAKRRNKMIDFIHSHFNAHVLQQCVKSRGCHVKQTTLNAYEGSPFHTQLRRASARTPSEEESCKTKAGETKKRIYFVF